jgi:hypothetical protein
MQDNIYFSSKQRRIAFIMMTLLFGVHINYTNTQALPGTSTA